MGVTLVLGSANRKKAAELQRILGHNEWNIKTLADYPGIPAIEENGETFAGNAKIKALAVAAYTGEVALADDSGLIVDALNGAPGIHSARFAGNGGKAGDAANNALLLHKLQHVPLSARTARFVCHVAVAAGNEILWEGDGVVEGHISTDLHGGPDAFGYDPLFVPVGHTATFAEMSPEQKDGLSHRGRALKKASDFLASLRIAQGDN